MKVMYLVNVVTLMNVMKCLVREFDRILNRTGVSGHFTSFESESEGHVIIEAVKQLSARVA